MKSIILVVTALCLFSGGVFASSGKPVQHRHGERMHSHVLPEVGVGHSHNGGVKGESELTDEDIENLVKILKKSGDYTEDELSLFKSRLKFTRWVAEGMPTTSTNKDAPKEATVKSRGGSSNLKAVDVCVITSGAKIIAQDDKNTFLGEVTSRYHTDSIFNELGTYGNNLGVNSIWNELSVFGSELGMHSPNNDLAMSPPMLIKNGRLIGYLSANKMKLNSISPNLLKALCEKSIINI